VAEVSCLRFESPPREQFWVIPALNIVDATKDVLSLGGVSLSGALPDAGMMVLTPKKRPYSGRESVKQPDCGCGPTLLNRPPEPLVCRAPPRVCLCGRINTSAFVAIPSAPILGQPVGGVGRVDISTGAITATIPVPGAHYLVPSPTGNQVLIFSDNSNSVTLLFPGLPRNWCAKPILKFHVRPRQ